MRASAPAPEVSAADSPFGPPPSTRPPESSRPWGHRRRTRATAMITTSVATDAAATLTRSRRVSVSCVAAVGEGAQRGAEREDDDAHREGTSEARDVRERSADLADRRRRDRHAPKRHRLARPLEQAERTEEASRPPPPRERRGARCGEERRFDEDEEDVADSGEGGRKQQGRNEVADPEAEPRKGPSGGARRAELVEKDCGRDDARRPQADLLGRRSVRFCRLVTSRSR